MDTLIITTGGTIGALPYPDPVNPPLVASMPETDHDMVKEALWGEAFDNHRPFRIVSMEPRDSQHIDQKYRENILNIIRTEKARNIIITHGTDTILTSADFFYHHIPGIYKWRHVTLTGSMTPLANGPESDGYQNVSWALSNMPPLTSQVSIVLSDFASDGRWAPRRYPYQPHRYEKDRTGDGRYYRLKDVTSSTTLSR